MSAQREVQELIDDRDPELGILHPERFHAHERRRRMALSRGWIRLDPEHCVLMPDTTVLIDPEALGRRTMTADERELLAILDDHGVMTPGDLEGRLWEDT